MNLTTEQIGIIEENKLVVLATTNKYGQPRAIFVGYPKCLGGKIVLVDNFMNITKINIIENPLVSILAYNKDYSHCFTISGKAAYYSDASHLEWAKSLEENKELNPKGVIEVIIENVEESK